jgi:crotonobetainyl-CoA:carnitine CoA-transferase CaiB-like acyl-CoA transferase
MRLPLQGITVVAVEQAVAAPFATRQLGDLGARVIKVERPGAGDFARGYDRTVHGQSSYFVWLNRGKESVQLNLRDPGDRAVLDAILDRADVLVQNLVPGAAGRLGLDAATVRATRPRLICCSISGYGPDGPYGAKKAYDLLVQCETGLVASTGTAEVPSKAGISVADIAAGMYAYSGILAALYDRERTGLGTSLHVAMLDALGEWTLCGEILHRPDLVTDPRFRTNTDRVGHGTELTALLEEALGDLDADSVRSATATTLTATSGWPAPV